MYAVRSLFIQYFGWPKNKREEKSENTSVRSCCVQNIANQHYYSQWTAHIFVFVVVIGHCDLVILFFFLILFCFIFFIFFFSNHFLVLSTDHGFSCCATTLRCPTCDFVSMHNFEMFVTCRKGRKKAHLLQNARNRTCNQVANHNEDGTDETKGHPETEKRKREGKKWLVNFKCMNQPTSIPFRTAKIKIIIHQRSFEMYRKFLPKENKNNPRYKLPWTRGH